MIWRVRSGSVDRKDVIDGAMSGPGISSWDCPRPDCIPTVTPWCANYFPKRNSQTLERVFNAHKDLRESSEAADPTRATPLKALAHITGEGFIGNIRAYFPKDCRFEL